MLARLLSSNADIVSNVRDSHSGERRWEILGISGSTVLALALGRDRFAAKRDAADSSPIGVLTEHSIV